MSWVAKILRGTNKTKPTKLDFSYSKDGDKSIESCIEGIPANGNSDEEYNIVSLDEADEYYAVNDMTKPSKHDQTHTDW